MNIKIVRLENTNIATFGAMLIEEELFCMTLERPWLNNQTDVSCIPEGKYILKAVKSPHFGDSYEVQDVPNNRTSVLLHKGNFVSDSKGCILLGKYFGYIGNERAVLLSERTVKEFNDKISKNSTNTLEIIKI